MPSAATTVASGPQIGTATEHAPRLISSVVCAYPSCRTRRSCARNRPGCVTVYGVTRRRSASTVSVVKPYLNVVGARAEGDDAVAGHTMSVKVNYSGLLGVPATMTGLMVGTDGTFGCDYHTRWVDPDVVGSGPRVALGPDEYFATVTIDPVCGTVVWTVK